MTSPIAGSVKLITAGLVGGLTLAAAASEMPDSLDTLKHLAPTFSESVMALIATLVMKVYVPSKRSIESEFGYMKLTQEQLAEQLERLVHGTDRSREEFHEWNRAMARWMGTVDSKMQDHSDRLHRIEDRQDAVR